MQENQTHYNYPGYENFMNETGNDKNVGNSDRLISAIGGGILLIWGLTRKSWLAKFAAITGGTMLLKSATGKSMMYKSFGINTKEMDSVIDDVTSKAVDVEKTVYVERQPDEVYRYWRNLENLPRFMSHLEEVKTLDGRKSHWMAKAPLGMKVEWDAEIVDERENEFISWKSLDGADIRNQGEVRFELSPDGNSTQVRVRLRYEPPAGKLGAAFAKLFGEEPNQQIEEDLNRFKQKIQSGELIAL